MARNNITIKDVAREAGVSIATVSYVVNNRTDVRISEPTRKKVLQVINLLGYTPNQAAKALVSNRKSLIAVYLPSGTSPLGNAEDLSVLKVLSNFFHRNRFEILLLNDEDLCKCDHADAIICYNTAKDTFFRLGDNNFVPLIALDCMVDDPLFYQINTDPATLLSSGREHFGSEDFTVVMLPSSNEDKMAFYRNFLPSLTIVSSYEDLPALYGKNVVVVDSVLSQLLAPHCNGLLYHPSLSDTKLDYLKECIDATLERTPIEQHDLLV
ncbi:MAG: LacI family DNA-binding transcriptional regulator [Firmicutes bacterium]|nr:LacI family DNA-binding transcriptional regulator [Bacillota bacterium]